MPSYSFEASCARGTNAELWVSADPAVHQELAQRYLAGSGDA